MLRKATQVTPIDDLTMLYAYPAIPPNSLSGVWLRANMITSLDGAAALDGKSGSLGSDGDREVFRVLRGLADVVIAGAGTVIGENYRPIRPDPDFAALRRSHGQPLAPLLAVVSAALHLPTSHPALLDANTVILTCRSAPANIRESLISGGATLIDCGEDNVDLREVSHYLAGRRLWRTLCEGGPSLLGSFVDAGLLDELCLTISPIITGGSAGRILRGHADSLAHHMRRTQLLSDDEGYLFTRWIAAGRDAT